MPSVPTSARHARRSGEPIGEVETQALVGKASEQLDPATLDSAAHGRGVVIRAVTPAFVGVVDENARSEGAHARPGLRIGNRPLLQERLELRVRHREEARVAVENRLLVRRLPQDVLEVVEEAERPLDRGPGKPGRPQPAIHGRGLPGVGMRTSGKTRYSIASTASVRPTAGEASSERAAPGEKGEPPGREHGEGDLEQNDPARRRADRAEDGAEGLDEEAIEGSVRRRTRRGSPAVAMPRSSAARGSRPPRLRKSPRFRNRRPGNATASRSSRTATRKTRIRPGIPETKRAQRQTRACRWATKPQHGEDRDDDVGRTDESASPGCRRSVRGAAARSRGRRRQSRTSAATASRNAERPRKELPLRRAESVGSAVPRTGSSRPPRGNPSTGPRRPGSPKHRAGTRRASRRRDSRPRTEETEATRRPS